ncbi:MAG: hypothetical protein LUC38_10215 [Oscillospiraceae bacterium]|nr:hypothetical protein [Ruminococcus sp.]MCD8346303.1 hypothetical protein [Oscillospiraceae bacterium]
MESAEFNQEAYDRYLFDEEKYSGEDFALLMAVTEKYQEILEESDDEDFEINLPQYQKLLAVYAYFTKYIKSYGGKIEDIKLSPREEVGDITVFIPNLYLECEEVETFAKALEYGCALTIDSGDNGSFCLSMTIPSVFKEKGKPVRNIAQSPIGLGDEPVGAEISEVISKFRRDIKQILDDGQYRISKSVYDSLYEAVLFFAKQKMIDDSNGIEGTDLLPVNLFVEMSSAQLTAEFIVFQPMDSISYSEFLNVVRSASSLQIAAQPDGMHISIVLTFDGLFVPV